MKHGWSGLVALAALSVPGAVSAQIPGIDDARAEYVRLLQISGFPVAGSFNVRPLDATLEPGAGIYHPWAGRPGLGASEPGADPDRPSVSLLDPRLRAFFNSSHPTGQNDGSVWQGKGVTTAVDVGVALRWRALSVVVAPTLGYAQNADFPLATVTVPGQPAYAYPWRRIDLPQRFGPDAEVTLDPGQSEAALGWRGVRAGFGTRNLWWGPARRNALVMSDNAAGFPHGFLGTDGPLETPLGSVEARWIWGRLAQSDWFDPTVTRTDRFLTGLVASYAPSFLEGLSIGGARVFYGLVPDGGVTLGDYFLVLSGIRKSGLVTPDNPTGDDEQDQLLSLFFRWVLPESGFEAYGEWARNDHAWDFTDLVQEPEHSQAYTLGLQKAIPIPGTRLLALWTEISHLERSRTVELRASPVYYTHHIAVQGYTHRGQVLGAGIGPGGDAQGAGVDLYTGWGRVGAFVLRDVHDNDAYYDWAEANGAGFCCHDVSLRLGSRGTYFLDGLELGGGVVLTRELNRYFDDEAWNLALALDARVRAR